MEDYFGLFVIIVVSSMECRRIKGLRDFGWLNWVKSEYLYICEMVESGENREFARSGCRTNLVENEELDGGF